MDSGAGAEHPIFSETDNIPPPNYDQMRVLTHYALENWLQNHPEKKSVGSIRILTNGLRSPDLDQFPSDKEFLLESLDDESLTFLLNNTKQLPNNIYFRSEARKRQLQSTLDSTVSSTVPEKIIELFASKDLIGAN